jgi:hypothetical protein
MDQKELLQVKELLVKGLEKKLDSFIESNNQCLRDIKADLGNLKDFKSKIIGVSWIGGAFVSGMVSYIISKFKGNH